jgi:hypothetical protein
MSKQTDLINIPDAITVSGAVVTESASASTVEHTINNETSSGNRYSMITFKDQGTNKYYQYQNHNDGHVLIRNEHATGSLQFMTGGANERLRIDATGAVTMPHQPAFSAMPHQPAFSATKSSKQSNVAVSSAVTVVFDTEVFDQNADFSSNTFTAPVTGKYQLNLSLYTNEIDSAADYYMAVIKTSNREYQNVIDPRVLASDPVYWNQGVSVLADMDANDTAYVFIQQGNGNQQTDVATPSFFSGYLVA